MSLGSVYNPKEYEHPFYQEWQKAGIGKPKDIEQKLENDTPHTILMPPPNLTGDLHAGHAFQHFLMDTIMRIARQKGESALWYPGVDHAGIQLEGVIDKLIKQGEFAQVLNENIPNYSTLQTNKEDLPKNIKSEFPEVWLDCAWSKVDLWRDNQQKQSAILGDTPDYERSLFTLDDRAVKMVNKAYIKYWQDGLIYKGSYLVNWSVGLQTAVSDVAGEIEFVKGIDPFVTFEYPLYEDKNGILTPLETRLKVGTVRPETIFGDYALAINHTKIPDEIKDKDIKYIKAKIPLSDRFIPLIIATDEEVDPDFGTGILKITPASDMHDFSVFQKYIGGDFEGAIGRDGKLTALCGEFAGKSVLEGRLLVVDALGEAGFVVSINENYEHNVSICERSKTVIEPLISEEFFVDYHKPIPTNNPNKPDTNYLIFDFDGVLADSWNATVLAFMELHNEPDRATVEKYLRDDRLVTPRYTKDRVYTELESAELMNFRKREYELKEKFGVCFFSEFIEEIKKIKHKQIAIVSTALQSYLNQFAASSGLDFTHVLGFSAGFSKEKCIETICADWGVEVHQTLFFTDTLRDVIEAKNILPIPNIFGCSWGFHSKEYLSRELSESQILLEYSDIHDAIGTIQPKTLAQIGLEAVSKTEFHPHEYRGRAENFLNNINNWCISRDLLWGHKMPVWYNLDLNPDKNFYSKIEIVTKPELSTHLQITTSPPIVEGNWVQEEKILDTWFSSCLWPLSTLGFADLPKVFVLHGRSVPLSGSFYQYAQRELEKLGYEVEIIEFPDSLHGLANSWLDILKQYTAQFENAIILTHSLASLALSRFLTDNPTVKLHGWHSFGGVFGEYLRKDQDDEITQIVSSFSPNSIDYVQISDQIGNVFIHHSRDDPRVDFSAGEAYYEHIPKAQLISYTDKGHFISYNSDKEPQLVDPIELPSLIKLISQNPSNQTDFSRFYPTQEMITGKDIFYQWIVRMTMLSTYFAGQIPYQKVVITPTVQDEKGRKMSKSLGNGLDAVATINKYSSDSLRMAMLGAMIPDRNIKMGGNIADGLCEKYRNFGNKLWNVARFFEYQDEKLLDKT